MKILGISFGTLNGNSETLTKAALMGAQEAGAQVELLRYMDFDIAACDGCLECAQPGNLGRCHFHDDFELLKEHLFEADGIIFATPMYSWGPTDGFRILSDRLNAGHNVAWLKKNKAGGHPERFDQRIFKARTAGMITVGGTKEETKTVTTVPLMHMMTYGMNIHVIDHVICKDTGAPGGVLAYPEKVEHAFEMGKRLASSCQTDAPAVWAGGNGGLCPHCHNDLVNFRLGTHSFRCAVCGLSGQLKWQDGQLIPEITLSENNRPIQDPREMDGLLEEFEQTKQRWEQTSAAAELKTYETYPVSAFHLEHL